MGSSTGRKRVLLKISGEALAGERKQGFDASVILKIAGDVKQLVESGVECALVIGAGNLFRGNLAEGLGIDRVKGDFMGMLSTIMNGIAFEDVLLKMGVKAKVMSAIDAGAIAEPWNIYKAGDFLSSGGVVIAAGGTGNPFFTTDTAAALRAAELGADFLLKATRVDGVFSADPEKELSAERYESLSYREVIEKSLRVMDLTAVSICMENSIPIVVFDVFKENALMKIVSGEKSGTIIS